MAEGPLPAEWRLDALKTGRIGDSAAFPQRLMIAQPGRPSLCQARHTKVPGLAESVRCAPELALGDSLNMALSFTGERFLPSCAGEMVYEHWHRYLFVAQYAQGKRVLDVACGEGYGSALLARHAASVLGVDVSADAVAHAQARYGDAPNLDYRCADCRSIPEADARFDLIVSFETIEHIDADAQAAFLREIARLLTPEGMLIISSPNRVEYTERTGYQNEFHVHELDRSELAELLDPHFSAQRWFAQRPCFQSLVWPIDRPASGAAVLSVDGQAGFPQELYFLVCCARRGEVLDAITPEISLVTDREHSVYAEWSRTYAENRELQKKLAALQAQLVAPPQPTDGLLKCLVKAMKRLLR